MESKMQEMNALQVHQYLQTAEQKPLLLDVREPWEFDICHIEGSKHIPMQKIPGVINQLATEQEEQDRDIIVICHHGIRSRMVARFLEQADLSGIINLSGGVNQWAQQVDPQMPVY
jgi:rhodanese-related sulfurtransferase